MNLNTQLNTIEKKITVLMSQIKNGEITMSESKIGKQFTKLKTLDLPLYEKLLKDYKKIVSETKKIIDNG
jgi:hypothetical protein